MKPRRLLLFIASALVLIAAGWFWFGRASEPKYDGKPVSYWFRSSYSRWHSGRVYDDASEAVTALRTLGTNALPYLVKQAMSAKGTSQGGLTFRSIFQKLPEEIRPDLPPAPDDIRWMAEDAVHEMNLPADAIYPYVQRYLDGKNVEQQTTAYLLLLAGVSPSAAMLPRYEQALQSTNYYVDYQAASKIGFMGSNALPALPVLLKKFQSEPSWQRRAMMALAICRIDPQQPDALAYLVEGLKGRQSERFAGIIGMLGTNGQPAQPALWELLRDTTNVQAVTMALRRTGASNKLILSSIRERLNSAPDSVKLDACKAILQLDPANVTAASTLIELARKNGAQYWLAIADITNAGPAAQEAIPQLEQLTRGTNTQLSISAFLALKKIRANQQAK